MITDFFLNTIFDIQMFIIGLIPVAELPQGVNDFFNLFFNAWVMAQQIFPIGTLLTIIGLILTYEGVILSIKIWTRIFPRQLSMKF